jgi:uncharacterized Ntn-hydrolase superfamily protein
MPRLSVIARRVARRPHRLAAVATLTAAVAGLARPATATWSIVIADSATREVGVGTVTCLTSLDLLAVVPVVVVGEGAAACQAAGDFNGTRRPIINLGFRADRPPRQILLSLAGVSGHQSRQYGIVDTDGEAVTFTGSSTLDWAGGVVGGVGTLSWAIQGNILVGPCVVDAIEAAMLDVPAGTDMAGRLMAGMEAARDAGGDGRCSCAGDPTGCGCPVLEEKSGHIGGMVVARVGDVDDPSCNSGGCVDGQYFMRLNVANQSPQAPDPVDQLREQFDAWRAERAGRIDALATEVALAPLVPANGASVIELRVTPRNASGETPDEPATALLVEHAEGSDGRADIGRPQLQADGSWTVAITAGDTPGDDAFRLVLDDGAAAYEVMPRPTLSHRTPGDVDGNGTIDFGDVLAVLAAWGPCPSAPAGCPADADGSGAVDFGDLLVALASFDGA